MLNKFSIPLLIFALVSSMALAQSAALSSGFYDDSVPLLSYGGGIQTSGVSGYYLQSHSQASSLDFEFISTGFTFYGRSYDLSPDVSVCIDAICQTISLYSATEAIGALFTISGLDYGLHSVSMTAIVTGGDSLFYVDALAIESAFAPEVTATPDLTVVEWTVGDSSQLVRFQYEMSAGDVLVSSLVFILILIIAAYVAFFGAIRRD